MAVAFRGSPWLRHPAAEEAVVVETSRNSVSFRLVAADRTASDLFNPANNPTALVRPLLSITAVPEPHACSLLVAGAIFHCSAGCRHGKQRG